MRAGRLDRLIDIQRATSIRSASGEPQMSWANLTARRPASVAPVKGEEKLSGPEIAAHQQVEFRIRYSANVSALTPKDRIIYPAMNDGDSDIPEMRIFNILQVNELGRREGLQIIAERRPDTPA